MYSYTIDISKKPPSCLPSGLDISYLVDITLVTSLWRAYRDSETKRVHDGAHYYQLLLNEFKDNNGN